MRVVLFFDLPVKTKKDRRIYSNFRKYLLSNGYIMLQYSVYSKILNNRDSAVKHIESVEKNVPKKGNIRIMMVTEKQFSNIKIIVGGKTLSEKVITRDPFIHL